jgi:hypothetical protein
MQQDPAPGKIGAPVSVTNRYAYSANNPFNLTDPSGLSFFDFVVDFVVAVAAVVLIVASGGGFLAALAAVGSVAGGAAAGAAIYATVSSAFSGDWSTWGDNFTSAFHTDFRIGLGLLAGGAIIADFGGGLISAGGNGLQGYIQAADPILGGGGFTLGSASVISGVSPLDLIGNSGVTTFAQHEFGHTLQWIGLSALGSVARNSIYGIGGVLGLLHGPNPSDFLQSLGTHWENSASGLGSW